MKSYWWKALCIILIFYTLIWGLLGNVPRLPILHETIRNLYFHVTMWFGMLILLTISLANSIKFLYKYNLHYDTIADETAKVGMLFGLVGLATGSLWAKYTWGAWWVNDTKLNGAAASMLVYIAYMLLRNSMPDEQKRARIAAVYNIFAYFMMLVLIMILPRLTDSLHPGNGGNPGFSNYDLNSGMRMVFYPAIAGWTLLGWWLVQTKLRIRAIKQSKAEAL